MKKNIFLILLCQCIIITLGCNGKEYGCKKCVGNDTTNCCIDSISESKGRLQFCRDSIAVLDQLYLTNDSARTVLEYLLSRKGGKYPENFFLLLRECEEGTALIFNHVHEETNRIIDYYNGNKDSEYQLDPDIQVKGCLIYNNLNIFVMKYIFDDDKIVDDLFDVRDNKVLLERQPVTKAIEETETGEIIVKIYHEAVSYYYDGKTVVKKPYGMLRPMLKHDMEDVSIKRNN